MLECEVEAHWLHYIVREVQRQKKMVSSRLCSVGFAVAILLFVASPVRAEDVRQVVGKDRVHVVQSGETLYTIAQHYGLAIEHLAFANNLSPDSINVPSGTELIVPTRRILPSNPPNNGLVVNIPERGVFLFRNGSFVKFYPVAIGQPGRFATPQGNFTIENKTVDPAWMPPEWAETKELVPAGPDNPLGDRWIGLSAPGIGLHSTTSPMSIGQAASHGCMRMYPNSVRELFERVEVGWPARIEYETAKVGYDENKKVYCMVTFPDVYGESNPYNVAEKELLKCGFGVDSEDLRQSVYKDGVVMDLTAVDPSVPVNIVIKWSEQPVLVDGVVMAPAKVAAQLGMVVNWDSERQLVKVGYQNTTLFFSCDEHFDMSKEICPEGKSYEYGGVAVRKGNTTMIPVRSVINVFNVANSWDSASKTLRLTKVKQ